MESKWYVLGLKFHRMANFLDPPRPRGYFLYIFYLTRKQYIRPKYHNFGRNIKQFAKYGLKVAIL